MFTTVEATSEEEALEKACDMSFDEFDAGSSYPDMDDVSVVDVEDYDEIEEE